MKSRAAIAGHPIHPVLVSLPIGLLTWAFIANVVYAISDADQMWYDISFWSAIAGVTAALVAAVPGLIDGAAIGKDSDARAIATGHMLLNIVLVLLFGASIFVMRDNGAATGAELTLALILQGIGLGLLVLSGWLGGEMVFRHHLGSIPEDAEVARQERQRHTRSERGPLPR